VLRVERRGAIVVGGRRTERQARLGRKERRLGKHSGRSEKDCSKHTREVSEMLKGELSIGIALTTLMVSKAKATLVDRARTPLGGEFWQRPAARRDRSTNRCFGDWSGQERVKYEGSPRAKPKLLREARRRGDYASPRPMIRERVVTCTTLTPGGQLTPHPHHSVSDACLRNNTTDMNKSF
jgi:hypothetical protein